MSEDRVVERHEFWERFWHDLPAGEGEAVWDSPGTINAGLHMRWFGKHFAPSLPLLDLGCGNGTQSAFLSEHYATVVGLEIAESAVTAAARTYQREGLSFRQFDVLDEASVHAVHDELGDCNVYVRTLLHVFPRDEQLLAATHIAQLIGESGALFIAEMPHSAGSVFEAEFDASEEALPKVRRNLEYGIVGANLMDGELGQVLQSVGIRVIDRGVTTMQSMDKRISGETFEIPLEYAIGKILG
jgi:2-polyprenyl-3-methyl-5-hydroxy-6-metoxy-1,4-benzoquinol methylase